MGSMIVDPDGDALIAALRWIAALLTGTLATAVAILAVAAIGIAALSGRIEVRRALVTLLGCFVLFGSTTIAAALSNDKDASSVAAQVPSAPTLMRPPDRPPGGRQAVGIVLGIVGLAGMAWLPFSGSGFCPIGAATTRAASALWAAGPCSRCACACRAMPPSDWPRSSYHRPYCSRLRSGWRVSAHRWNSPRHRCAPGER